MVCILILRLWTIILTIKMSSFLKFILFIITFICFCDSNNNFYKNNFYKSATRDKRTNEEKFDKEFNRIINYLLVTLKVGSMIYKNDEILAKATNAYNKLAEASKDANHKLNYNQGFDSTFTELIGIFQGLLRGLLLGDFNMESLLNQVQSGRGIHQNNDTSIDLLTNQAGIKPSVWG